MNAPSMLDRTHFLGSSDIAAVLGLSPWKTPLDLYLEKTGQGPGDDPDKAKIFRRGKRLEPIVVEMLAEEYGYLPVARNMRYIDTEYPFMACEVDAETMIGNEHVNLEIKTAHPFAAAKFGDEGSDEIPVEYAAQAMYSLMITGRRRCILGVLVGSDNLSTYEVLRDEDTIAGMRKAGVQFWQNNVLAGVPPAPVNLPDVYNLFRKNVATTIEATKEVAEMVLEFSALKRTAASADAGAEDLKYRIGLAMLGADAVVQDDKAKLKPGPGAKPGCHLLKFNGMELLTIRHQSATRIDSDALRERYPTIATECSKTSSFFTFALSRKKQ